MSCTVHARGVDRTQCFQGLERVCPPSPTVMMKNGKKAKRQRAKNTIAWWKEGHTVRVTINCVKWSIKFEKCPNRWVENLKWELLGEMEIEKRPKRGYFPAMQVSAYAEQSFTVLES